MAIVASLVSRPRITSTSGICRTGLKKCKPQNRSGCSSPSASCVIGIVDVFERGWRRRASSGSSRANSCCLASRLFDDRFDDDVGVAQLDVGQRAVHERGQLDGPLHVGAFELLVVRDFVQHALHAARQCRLIGIHERDGNAALDVGGRDALPHDAGADDAGRRDLSRRHVAP